MAKNSYIAKSRASLEALRSANLLKSLNLNVLITGDIGVGKESLAKYIYEDGYIVLSQDCKELSDLIQSDKRLIIKNFNQIDNFAKIRKVLDSSKNKVIATSREKIDSKIEDDFFSIKIHIPPLNERPEDVEELSRKFFEEAKEIFNDSSKVFDFNKIKLDLSKNCYSLKKSIYKYYFSDEITQEEMMENMKIFLINEIGSGNDYRKFLYLFEIPLIKSGYEKFGSKLSMSEAFGLNRNTLRKKILSYKLEGIK